MNQESDISICTPGCFRIEINGHLQNDRWNRFGSMQILPYVQEDGSRITILQGNVRDQAELSGFLNTLYELHFALRSVKRLGSLPKGDQQSAQENSDE